MTRKASPKLKVATGKTAKRPKPRKAKFITRGEARRRAERYVFNRMFKGATVQDIAESSGCFYNPPNDAWVVYKKPQALGFRSSEVVLVCKHTGRVLYEGSAHDEG
jgi:hypothetical protein